MNTYYIELENGWQSNQVAKTPGKAKSSYWREITDCWDVSYLDFLKTIVHCRKVGRFKPSDLFGDQEQFDRIKKARGIDFAYMGMRIEVCGKMGTIVRGNSSMNLDVVFDGEFWTDNCHPWYKTKYFDRDGKLIREYMD